MITRTIFVVCSTLLTASFFFAFAAPGLAQDASSEPDFLALWSTHRKTPENHVAISAACNAFRSDHPRSQFRSVCDALDAWHMLAASQTNDAARLLRSLSRSTKSSALDVAARDIARAWLTRLDREAVREALETEYTKNIAYPETLDGLKAMPDPPRMKDRWNREWIYRKTGFKLLTGLHGQRYSLESLRLKPHTDLRDALARPYGGDLRLAVAREISRKAGSEIVELRFETGGETSKVVLSMGATKKGLAYVYRGRSFMIFANDYWHVVGAR